MLSKASKIAMILPNAQEGDVFMMGLGALNARNVTCFTSAREAYQVAVRQQFDFFVTRMEMPDLSGIVLVQKLRETGNYGQEVHLFVCEKLNSKIMNVLYEMDISYVLVSPFTKQLVSAKIAHVFQAEKDLPEFEQRFREARSAFQSNLLEMAESFARELESQNPTSEKVHVLLGDIASKNEQPDRMIVHYSNAAKVNPKSAVAAHKLAHAYMKRGDHRRAAQILNSLAHLNPYNIKLLENAGISNLQINDFEKAQSYASQLKTLDVKNKTASEVNVQVKIASGDFSGIADELRNSHDDKEIVAFLNNAGVKLAKGTDVRGALNMYQSCIEQLQDSKYIHAVYFNMGIAYKKLNDYENAASAYASAVRLKPDFEKAAQSLAECRQKLQETRRAS
ncbi:hypothetical protein E3A20_21720 [Planctomyces bekefii]|uniref:Response regulatory domain-containing protein n=1 Tax=Planctomyces bekefii TaxID=1653850 RepID=A0A5C6M1S8_9PLAN|nr:hypothetical protein E3A20_21720 [Planctomyces bekefii]